jgi:uncharacterized damage-inducible protein DinB
MSGLLKDLFLHQTWADARHWRAFGSRPVVFEDKALWDRLHHIHAVQLGFLAVARGEAYSFTKPGDYPDPGALREEARRGHEAAIAYVSHATPEDLARLAVIPWFKDAPRQITIGEALHQAVMHSQYHRGQNATRLRELGGEPPLTDFIIWLYKGRPPADWA